MSLTYRINDKSSSGISYLTRMQTSLQGSLLAPLDTMLSTPKLHHLTIRATVILDKFDWLPG